MDKLTFRRKCLEDPHTADPEFREAWRHDSELEAFRQSVLKTDDQLRSALDVPLPEGLAARLELACLLDDSCRLGSKPTRNWPRMPFALAASFLVTMVIGGWAISGSMFGLNLDSSQALTNVVDSGGSVNGSDGAFFERVNLQIANAVVEHAGHERWGSLDLTPEKADRLAELFVEFELPSTAANFLPKYAEHCPVLGQRTLHALFKGESSDVTLVVLPEHMTDLNSEMLVDDYFVHVQPIDSGTLVLSSESQTDLNHSLSLLTATSTSTTGLLSLAF